MTSHVWGDGFDFDRLNQAGYEIAEQFERNVPGYFLMWKEKYGTIRYEHTLKYGAAAGWFDADQPEHQRILYKIIQETIERYPDLKDELLEDIAASEEIVGKEVHDMYWKTHGIDEEEALGFDGESS